MPYGYTGKILRVNLSTREVSIDEPETKFYRRYMGGWNIIAHYLLKELPCGIDPLSPDNLLIFATGIVTGNPVAGAGRSQVGAKSPLTGGFGEADVGGWWGAELTMAGFDAIVIKGRSEKPVYLWVKDGAAEIRSAEHLWGMLTADTQAALREELGDKRVRVAQIGPAGEGLSRMAAVMHDINRAAGRTGLGAVMGSKNLKAIAVRGRDKKQVADPAALQSIAQWFVNHYPTTGMLGLRELGTLGKTIEGKHLSGGLPTRNFQQGIFNEGWEHITGTRMRDTILKGRDTCFACPVHCKRVVEISEGKYSVDAIYGGPEYEAVASLGSTCGVGDLSAIARANQLCNAYGLDTISCGATIAWAMECFERGLITTADTGGIELRFGNAAALVRMVEVIGEREGFGQLLGEGSHLASKTIGRGADAFLAHAKGQEMPMHEPRMKYGTSIGYAISPTGADHLHNFHDNGIDTDEDMATYWPFGILEPLKFNDLGPAKMRLAATALPWYTLCNALGHCYLVFTSFDQSKLVELVGAITGWDTSLHELLKAGERAYTMARAFNAREGFSMADDIISTRFFEPFRDGPSAGNAPPRNEFKRARAMLYQMMGWDKKGIPTAWKLHELGVGWVADELRRHGVLA